MTHEAPQQSSRIGRRTFIAGTAAAGFLAACSGDDDDGSSSPTSDGADTDGADTDTAGLDRDSFSIVQRYPSNVPLLVPGDVRLPFSLMKAAGFVIDGPDTLGAQIVDIDGNPIGERISAVRRDVAPGPYYAFTASIDEPGVYGIVIDGGPATGANFQVVEPAEAEVPLAGQVFAGFDTPTLGDSAGVDPICTREPNCDFHSVTLTEALSTGSPVAYFVGTPAFCQTGSCTPALEAVIDVQPDFSEVVFVHAEVWTDLTASEVAPAVEALSLQFEPVLFLIDADGVLVDRIDGLWNEAELRERMSVLQT